MTKTKTQYNGHKISWELKKNGTSILEFDPPIMLDNEEVWKFLDQWRERESANEKV